MGSVIALVSCFPQMPGPGVGPVKPVIDPATTQPSGKVLGNGETRVALLLPLSASGGAGVAANSMKNAAALAVRALGDSDIQVIVKDSVTKTGGAARIGPGAADKAREAIGEGVQVILGPLLAEEVTAAGQVARSANVPLIAFSTRREVAARGVYLMGILAKDQIERGISYAAIRGHKAFAALIPNNNDGIIYESLFREAAASSGIRVITIERYSHTRSSMEEAGRKITALNEQIDAVFIPEGGKIATSLAGVLVQNGLPKDRVRIVGTGQFDNRALFANPNLSGAWFAAPERSGFDKFAASYRSTYGREPTRNASVAYDAVVLTAALARQGRISNTALTNPNGFSGIDGIFRLRKDGTNQRGLAVWEIGNGSARIASPAPKAF